MPKRHCVRATVIAIALAAPSLQAQSTYREPPPVIAAILDAAPTPSVSLSPDRSRMALLQRAGYPSIAEVAAPELRLAGLRFDPVTNGPSRGSGVRGISVQPVRGGEARALSIPLPTGDAGRGAPIANVSWSPSGEQIFFTITDGERIQPWVANVATGAVRRLADVRLNAVLGAPCSWLGAEPALICRLVPAGRGAAPATPTTPDGPILQESEGGRADRVATYQDLLKSPHDETLFTYYATSQVARIDLTGTVTPIGAPGIIADVTPSPDGRYLLVTTHSTPYSYVVPLNFFPTTISVWDGSGREVTRVHTLPLREQVPWGGDAVAEGPRSVRWRADADATLVWYDAPRGDTIAVNGVRDRV
ncbi:MAG: hypothetical protein MUD17_07560, partial [Gemmatimonadaceae bacterium]|nr:hypothetical protein [Gemmatimonadaceae bacterium]